MVKHVEFEPQHVFDSQRRRHDRNRSQLEEDSSNTELYDQLRHDYHRPQLGRDSNTEHARIDHQSWVSTEESDWNTAGGGEVKSENQLVTFLLLI